MTFRQENAAALHGQGFSDQEIKAAIDALKASNTEPSDANIIAKMKTARG